MTIKHFSLLLGIVVAFIACKTANSDQKDQAKATKVIIAYVFDDGSGNISSRNIDAAKLTHINYAFANVVDGKATFVNETDKGNIDYLTDLRAKHPHLKLLVSVGGWTWSGNFSDAALTETSRKVFAKSCADMVETYQLDGIDIDWEYPSLPGAGNIHRPEDRENFALLMKAIREALDEYQEASGQKHKLLTIASGAPKICVDNADFKEASKYLDYVNIMTYDFYTQAEPRTGHHSNLYPSALQTDNVICADSAVSWHHQAGVPMNKIVLGVPFYARAWKGVNPENNGRYQQAEINGPGWSYSSLVSNVLTDADYQQLWDEKAQVPYLWNAKEKIFVTYDNAKSLKIKCEYVRSKGLAGTMFWRYKGDHNQELLNTLYTGMNKE